MIFRLGRHRRRNLYAQHGHQPSNDDVFVALFEDEHMAERVRRLLNAEEDGHRRVEAHRESWKDTVAGVSQAEARRMQPSAAPVDQPLTPNSECTCGHPFWMHNAGPGGRYCSAPEATDTCVQFERRCEERYIGHWSSRCELVAGHHDDVHVSGNRRFTQKYTQRGER